VGRATALFPRYPHKLRRGISRFWYPVSLTIIIILLVCAVLVVLYDTGHQLVMSSRQSRISDLFITFGTYVVMALFAVVIIISRVFKFRAFVAAIPKGYIPTKAADVPKPAFELISTEYDRTAVIAHLAEPKGRQQEGWGRPGTQHEGVHFRSSILSTREVLRSVLPPLPTNQARSAPLSPLGPLLALRPSPVPPALNPLAELYEQYLVAAQYGTASPTEEDWDSVVKIVAVFVGLLGPARGGTAEQNGIPSG